MKKLKEAKYIKDFTLKLFYADGEIRKVDLSGILDTGIFRDLKNLKVFTSYKISFNTLEWPNGADIDPESLYNLSVPYGN